MGKTIQVKRALAASWSSTLAETVLASGEIGLEKDTGRFKFGDGVKTWTQLAYSDATDIVDDLDVITEQNQAQYATKAASAKAVKALEDRVEEIEAIDTIDGGDLDEANAEPGD